MRALILQLAFLSFPAIVCSQDVDLTSTRSYDSTVFVLKIINDELCTILDTTIQQSKSCENVSNISKFVIEVLPIQGRFLVGGIHISRIEDGHFDFNKAKTVGYLEYKGYPIVVYSTISDDFHDFHWAFRKTELIRDLSFNVDYELFEDVEVSHYLNWWYVYHVFTNEFELSYHYDCFGNVVIGNGPNAYISK